MNPTTAAATRIDGVVAGLLPIGLDELNARAELLTRVDRKYVVPAVELPGILAHLDPRTLALEFEGPERQRSSAYESVYFDTPALDAFHLAAHARRRRYKVRTRTYLDAGIGYLEVKTRGGRSLTVKERLARDPAEAELGRAGRDYVASVLDASGVGGADPMSLHPVIATRYRRTTLLLPAGGGHGAAGDESRATIDQDLEWIDLGGPGAAGAFRRSLRLDDVVIVETKSGSAPGAVDRLLWRHGHRPDSVSKFATGLAALRPGLPRNKWSRLLRRHFDPAFAGRAA